MKSITVLSIVLILTLINTGCASSKGRACSPRAKRYGFFCFHGKNFGRYRSHMYKLGVKDGCITGEGHFRKNYRYSARYSDYIRGWIDGRSICRLDDNIKGYIGDDERVQSIEDEYYSYRDEVNKRYGL